MLVHRLRRRPNIEPALFQRVVFAAMVVYVPYSTSARQNNSIGSTAGFKLNRQV